MNDLNDPAKVLLSFIYFSSPIDVGDLIDLNNFDEHVKRYLLRAGYVKRIDIDE